MSDQLYVILDLTTLEATNVAAVAPMKAAAMIGRIMRVQGADVVGPPLEGRAFSKLTLEQLQYLWWNMTHTPPSGEYNELLAAVFEQVKALPIDKRSIADLEAEVMRLCPHDTPPEGEQAAPLVTALPKVRTQRGPPRAPGEPPKATSTTGKVWVIADAQLALLKEKVGDISAKNSAGWKLLRDAIIDACTAAGINEATAATQYSKWKVDALSKASKL